MTMMNVKQMQHARPVQLFTLENKKDRKTKPSQAHK